MDDPLLIGGMASGLDLDGCASPGFEIALFWRNINPSLIGRNTKIALPLHVPRTAIRQYGQLHLLIAITAQLDSSGGHLQPIRCERGTGRSTSAAVDSGGGRASRHKPGGGISWCKRASSRQKKHPHQAREEHHIGREADGEANAERVGMSVHGRRRRRWWDI